ncbi:hypothetical protein [Streptomyces nigra]|uniref:hypothetical protein n=1 Tax=Streptomyces nigra TaxID=1827580 RepID=UPI00341FD8BA
MSRPRAAARYRARGATAPTLAGLIGRAPVPFDALLERAWTEEAATEPAAS